MITPEQIAKTRTSLGLEPIPPKIEPKQAGGALTGQDLFKTIQTTVDTDEQAATAETPEKTPFGFLSSGKLGQSAGQVFGAGKGIKEFNTASKEYEDVALNLTKAIGNAKKLGQDTTRLENALLEHQKSAPELDRFLGQKAKTLIEATPGKAAEMITGEALGTVLEATSGGILSSGSKALATGGVKALVKEGAKLGAIYNGLGGVATGMEEGKSLGGVLKEGATGAATGLVAGGLTGGLVAKAPAILAGGKKLAGATAEKISNMAGKRSISKATELIQATEETMTKAERLAAIAEPGRVNPTKLGGKEFLPSETEKRAGEILANKLKSNPTKNVPIIKNEIATRGQEAESYLVKGAKKITNKEHLDMFAKARKEAEKSLTDSELKAYDEMVNMFSKQLPGRGGFNTGNYYKAVKDFETNVASKLARGKEALLDPTGVASAKIHAASDVRKIVRDMIAGKHPDFKGKMFDLASLYDALDNVIIKTEKLPGNVITRFAKKNPKTAAAIQYGAGGTALIGGAKAILGD